MKNLTTPQAILFGFGLVALAIASIPYSSQVITPAFASNGVHKIAICDEYGNKCSQVLNQKEISDGSTKDFKRVNRLMIFQEIERRSYF